MAVALTASRYIWLFGPVATQRLHLFCQGGQHRPRLGYGAQWNPCLFPSGGSPWIPSDWRQDRQPTFWQGSALVRGRLGQAAQHRAARSTCPVVCWLCDGACHKCQECQIAVELSRQARTIFIMATNGKIKLECLLSRQGVDIGHLAIPDSPARRTATSAHKDW